MTTRSTTLLATAAILLGATAAVAEPLRVGMTPEPYMPFTQVNAAGDWEGLEADLTRAICERIEDGCTFEQMAWDGLIPSLTGSKVDVIVGTFSVTDERREVVDFSAPYYTEGTVLVGVAGDGMAVGTAEAADGSGAIIDPAAVDGMIVGVQAASVQSNYASAYFPDAEIKTYDTADNAYADLVAGRVDYVLGPDLYTAEFLRTEDGAGFEIKASAPANPILGEGVAYAVQKGDTETLGRIDAALSGLREEGVVDDLVQTWIYGG